MKQTIITLIASSFSLLYASSLSISTPNEFVEVDPLLIRQPAKRIFLPKDKAFSGCSISVHREVIHDSIDQFFSKTKQFIESTFPMKFEAFKAGKTELGYPVSFFRLKPLKNDLDVESLHAYIQNEKEIYLLAFSAPSKMFGPNLAIFQTVLDSLKVMPSPFISEEEEEAFKAFFDKEKLSNSEFLKSKSLIDLLKKFRPNLKEDELVNKLFELRAYFYE